MLGPGVALLGGTALLEEVHPYGVGYEAPPSMEVSLFLVAFR